MTGEDRELLRIAVDAARRRLIAEHRARMRAACACLVCLGDKQGVVKHGLYAYRVFRCRCVVCRDAKARADAATPTLMVWEQLELKAAA